MTTDEMLRALAHTERRRILMDLLTDEGPLHVMDTPYADGDGHPERHLTTLWHQHLPLLTKHRLIEWDPESGRVWRGARFSEARPLIELVREQYTN